MSPTAISEPSPIVAERLVLFKEAPLNDTRENECSSFEKEREREKAIYYFDDKIMNQKLIILSVNESGCRYNSNVYRAATHENIRFHGSPISESKG